jgi:hypothetical protein
VDLTWQLLKSHDCTLCRLLMVFLDLYGSVINTLQTSYPLSALVLRSHILQTVVHFQSLSGKGIKNHKVIPYRLQQLPDADAHLRGRPLQQHVQPSADQPLRARTQTPC